jgi:hypothetical protein
MKRQNLAQIQNLPQIQRRQKLPESPHLTVVETITSPAETTTGFADISCDEDGNIFLGLDGPSAPAIRKFNPKGELATLFQPYGNPDITAIPISIL